MKITATVFEAKSIIRKVIQRDSDFYEGEQEVLDTLQEKLKDETSIEARKIIERDIVDTQNSLRTLYRLNSYKDALFELENVLGHENHEDTVQVTFDLEDIR